MRPFNTLQVTWGLYIGVTCILININTNCISLGKVFKAITVGLKPPKPKNPRIVTTIDSHPDLSRVKYRTHPKDRDNRKATLGLSNMVDCACYQIRGGAYIVIQSMIQR